MVLCPALGFFPAAWYFAVLMNPPITGGLFLHSRKPRAMHLFPGSTGMNARVETRSEPLHPKPRTTLQEECGEEVILKRAAGVPGWTENRGRPRPGNL